MIRTAIFAAALLCVTSALAQTAPATKPATPASPLQSAKMETGRLDINTATAEQLAAVKGLNKSFADAIVKARPFKSVEELSTSNILPADVFALVKDHLTVAK
jgi:DNA uptake protein ComE-like DNA-binding protein